MVKRITLTIPDGTWDVMEKMTAFGDKPTEIALGIIKAYLSEKSYIKSAYESSNK